MTLIKICGITSLDDARAAVDAGADALGFNFYRPSPRYIAPQSAREIIDQLPESIMNVGVFVNAESPQLIRDIADEAAISAVQLHGDESPDYCRELAADRFVIKTLAVLSDFESRRVKDYKVQAIMLDTKDDALRGGTGRVFDWSIARQVKQLVPKLVLAGGLSPENIQEAIEMVHPYAIDACSCLEDAPGKKNHERMRVFVERIRGVKP